MSPEDSFVIGILVGILISTFFYIRSYMILKSKNKQMQEKINKLEFTQAMSYKR